MKQLTIDDLDDLAIGSAILGSGGGGDPTYFHRMARYEIEKIGSIPLISLSEVKPDEYILPVCYMGAPLAETEKMPSGREYLALSKVVEKISGKKISVVMTAEIGGAVAFTPLMVAAQLGYRVLDGDMIGRAFPEAQMCSSHVCGINMFPVYMIDALGNIAILYPNDVYAFERIGRKVTIGMGSWSALAYQPLTPEQVDRCLIPKTISQAIAIGKSHRKAREIGNDPLETVLKICKGIYIGRGKIIDIDREISQGFVNGNVVIQEQSDCIELIFQNEYLIAKCNGKIVATTPDILMLLEQDTGTPITSESLQYGLKVNLIGIPAPKIWTTSPGLELVSPHYFGYDIDYHAIKLAKKKS